ncbi:MAG: hypothetical protein ACKO43_06835 [Alphaproteobacteria bacterium]
MTPCPPTGGSTQASAPSRGVRGPWATPPQAGEGIKSPVTCPPRAPDDPLLSKQNLLKEVAQGLMAPDKALKIIVIMATVLTGVFFSVPFFRDLLNIALPPLSFLGAIPLMALEVLWGVERIKRAEL